MVIEINSTNPIQSYQNTVNQSTASQKLASTESASEKTDPTKSSSLSTMKTDQQASLIAHLFGDGQSADENSLKMTFQAAIDNINEILRSEFGLSEDAVAPISEATLKQQGGMEYWTPENTAQRIVDGSTAFFAAFQSANPDLEGEALIDRFIEVIGGGVTQGFEEAKGLLGDIKVLEGSIADNIDKTYSLVQEGFQNFRNQYLGTSNVTDADTTTPKPDEPQATV